jgi:hypothetical protein
MKIVLIVCGAIAVLALLVSACSRRQPEKEPVLNYDDMIFLDAEDLAEGSIGSSYNEDIVPILKQYVAAPAGLVEERNAEAGSYKVTSQGQTYVIYSPDMNLGGGHSWGNATFAVFDIVNRQLEGAPVKFYAISGGNDLGGMFLDEETYDQGIKSLERKEDWPYLPKPDHPWYGQQHD